MSGREGFKHQADEQAIKADDCAEAESDTPLEDGDASLINSPEQESSCPGELMSDALPSSDRVSDSASAKTSAHCMQAVQTGRISGVRATIVTV